MTSHDPGAVPDNASDTSDRLYTPEELEQYAAEQAAREDAPVPQDPLSDPVASPLGDPLADPWGTSGTPPVDESPAADPATEEPPVDRVPADRVPADPPVVSASLRPPAGGARRALPAESRESEDHTVVRQRVAVDPAPPPPPAATEPEPEPEPGAHEPRRFMTATDFLDRRDHDKEPGPATWGWRGALNRWSGGLIKARMGAPELEHEQHRSAIQRDFEGPRTIAFINPKGGAAKTTGVLAAGYTFGTVRGGGVVAWDNNETRGTLGIRGTRGTHRNTTRELLEDLGRFSDVYQSRIGDLGAFVRSQGDAHFDVLASDERPDVTGTIHANDFKAVHTLLERFYRVLLVDTGNNMRAENWLAAAEAADLLVVTSTVREDTGYSGLWMLDALQDAGYADLKHKTVTVLSDPSPQVDEKLATDLTQVYEQRTREVYRVPYDPALVAGSVVPYAELSQATRRSWLRACAGMASSL